ncbi:MAG TPA: DUF3025 domain-containing protein [Casimicrobiaceae bacterium]|jgi:hypothetical protein
MHRGFAPYARWLDVLGGLGDVPDIAALNRVATTSHLSLPDGTALRFEVAPARRSGALAYERRIAEEGVIEFRAGSWHDFANALVWLAFPLAKAALNAVHLREGLDATANGRSRVRDAATLIDEAGLIFACDDAELVALLRAWQWRELFWRRRDAVARHVHASVIGHGLLERLRAPYRALTAQALVVDVAANNADATAAEAIRAPGFGPNRLTPVPIAALPGWDVENIGERLFDDRDVFRVKH